jgi:hypothetical protein
MGVRRRVARCLRSTARTLGVLCGMGRSILFHIGEGILVFFLRRGGHGMRAISARVGAQEVSTTIQSECARYS